MFQVAIRMVGPWHALKRWLGWSPPEGVVRVDGRMFYIAHGDRERRVPRSRVAQISLRRRSRARGPAEVWIDLTTGETIRLSVATAGDGVRLRDALDVKR